MRSVLVRTMGVAAAVVLAACGGGENGGSGGGAGTGGYVVEHVAEDGVDVVRTVSGSRWGGDAILVEELSIGEEVGDEPYLFGGVTGAWATEDRIYVVDSQVPAVRAYDHEGTYLHDVGSAGEGPGEYRMPMAVAVDGDGRVLVTDVMGARLNVYGADGSSLESWSLGNIQSAMGLALGTDGEIYTRMVEMPENMQFDGSMPDLRMGMQRVGPDGLVGDPIFAPDSDYEPPTVKVEIFGNTVDMPIIPLVPSFQWSMTPGGEMVSGVGTAYRFEIRDRSGGLRVIEKNWDPVEVEAAEIDYRAKRASEGLGRMIEDFQFDADLIPRTKPAFQGFSPDRSGRVWVVRENTGRPDPECTAPAGPGQQFSAAFSSGGDVSISSRGGGGGGSPGVFVSVGPGGGGGGNDEDPKDCWATEYILDVFDIASGEFLGSVQSPDPGFTVPSFVEGNTVIAIVPDELGTIRVKKYRMEIPGAD